MTSPKTSRNRSSVKKFVAAVEHEIRQRDANTLLKLMEEIVGEKPSMWGPSIVGFGSYHYVYPSGAEGDWPLTGFSPRKQSMSIYIMSGLEIEVALRAKLGKHKIGKSCLYITNLENVHIPTLKKLIEKSVAKMRKKYPASM